MKQSITEETRYVVTYKGNATARHLYEWCPPGQTYECNMHTARERFDTLVAMGRSGFAVDGLVPRYVSIVDRLAPETLPHRAGDQTTAIGNIMLALYVGETNDEPAGPWAERCEA